MNCITKIKQAYASYTKKEKLIADYLLEHRQEVLNASSQSLGEVTKTSPAAIIRFSKKLGYRGFSELKVSLASSSSEDTLDFNDVLDGHDSIETLIKKSKQSNLKTIETTYDLLNTKTLNEAIDTINQAKTVYLFGVGGSGVVCSDFQYKLMRVGKKVIFCKDMHVQLMFATAITKEDVIVTISYSGKTKEILTATKWAKKYGVPVIAITQFSASPLSKLANISLGIPSEEKELRIGAISSRISSLVITDLLYYGISKLDIPKTKEKLILTKNIIKEIE